MTVAEKLRLLAEFAETGEEFEICGDWDKAYKFKVFIENGSLFYIDESKKEWESSITLNGLIAKETTIKRLPFKPKKGEQYYLVSPDTGKGYFLAINHDGRLDRLILSRETVYRTEEEVKEEVRKRGWKVED